MEFWTWLHEQGENGESMNRVNAEYAFDAGTNACAASMQPQINVLHQRIAELEAGRAEDVELMRAQTASIAELEKDAMRAETLRQARLHSARLWVCA